MRKRGLCYRPVSDRLSHCLSVCLSRSCIVSRQRKILSNLFLSRPGSRPTTIILVFWPRAPVAIQREPFIGGAKYTGVGKICGFQLKSPFIWETVGNKPAVAMGADFHGSEIFGVLRYLCLYPLTQNDRFQHGNKYGEGVFYRSSPAFSSL